MARSRKKDKVKPHQKEAEKAAVETPHPSHPEMETEVGEKKQKEEERTIHDTRLAVQGSHPRRSTNRNETSISYKHPRSRSEALRSHHSR